MGKKTKKIKRDETQEDSLLEKLRQNGMIADYSAEIEQLEKDGGTLLSLEEIRDALSFIPGNLSDAIIEDRE